MSKEIKDRKATMPHLPQANVVRCFFTNTKQNK